MSQSRRVTIIVPVYGDWPSLKDCIESLKKHVNLKHTVMFVNDCGPEVDLIEGSIKKSIKTHQNFLYFRNSQNLGFVGTCNRAVLELDQTGNDILLLNSDTEVTPGFLEEIQEVMYANPKIGAVSPRSNNATICTVPISAIRQRGIEAKKSYMLFQEYSAKFPRYNSVPTAHGFCMLIRRTLIRKYGLFDPVFGKGYGEEVDFCQRIAKRGYLSVLSNWSYVFHLEARSFSIEAKLKMVEKNSEIILKRYPEYKNAVNGYIEKALSQESKIFGKDAQSGSPAKKSLTKDLIRRHPQVYKIARAINKRVRG